MKNNKGFTLIELLVVVLIIGILAAIALPQYFKAVEKSRAAEANTILGAVNHAEAVFFMGAQEYTSDFAALDVDLPGGASGNSYRTDHFNYVLANDASNISAARITNNATDYTIQLRFSDGARRCDNGNTSVCSSMGLSTDAWE